MSRTNRPSATILENVTLARLVPDLEDLLATLDIKPNTANAKRVEAAYIRGIVQTLGGVDQLPPVIARCSLARKSILTLKHLTTL